MCQLSAMSLRLMSSQFFSVEKFVNLNNILTSCEGVKFRVFMRISAQLIKIS